MSTEQSTRQFRGPALGPHDPGYDEARTVVMGGIDPRPDLIVRVADADDVAGVIELARQAGSELAVRSGGHSGAGHSTTDGGIVLDVRDLDSFEIDVPSRTAWAGAGLTAGRYTTAAAEHGLATGFGDTGSVGLGGLTLGGGVGLLSRKYGLTIDSLLAAEVVTADGELLRVDDRSHPDLFWAIRGGGGSFGVATRFQFRLHPVDDVVGGILVLPATAEVVAGFVAAAEAAPDELTTIANVMTLPPVPFVPAEHHGSLVVMALICFAGDPGAADRALAPFVDLAPPLANLVAPMKYANIFLPEDPDYHPTAVSQTMFMKSVDLDTATTILDRLAASDATMRVTQLRVLGGAIARVAPAATAYAHRTSRIMVNVAAFYDGQDDRPAKADWVADLARAIYQGDDGAYVNFLAQDGQAGVRAAYPGQTGDRLERIKATYDPGNVFRRNQNIRPATGP
ncbi:FAD-binding oxidoreductase [Pengzhenrongella frigida]|uniref:FAD-binding oxidoreductase n=1 Tax=Pengzhenrongella frigida TaxID=1259133 RepID=A0A4Q5N282_9MICO|nr:FAD-binding oxidoreductase [Cellulomonas sp. HLT2-17]RYV52292.1 FAD-binding oxidoreductase [Cellulomonas sp. HLT2-17]